MMTTANQPSLPLEVRSRDDPSTLNSDSFFPDTRHLTERPPLIRFKSFSSLAPDLVQSDIDWCKGGDWGKGGKVSQID